MAKDYSKKMKESALIQQTEEYMDNEVFGEKKEQEPVTQPTPQAKQQPAVPQQQPVPPVPQQPIVQPAVVSTPSPYLTGEGRGEGLVLKNVGAKIPYSIYDRLERIKRQSERTGNKAEKRNIGDLIAQAIKEFVEKYDRPTPNLP